MAGRHDAGMIGPGSRPLRRKGGGPLAARGSGQGLGQIIGTGIGRDLGIGGIRCPFGQGIAKTSRGTARNCRGHHGVAPKRQPVAIGGAVEAESEQLVAFGALAGQLVSAPDAATEPAAALLRVCQTLLQPLMDDMSHLRPALHRAAAENEDLARRLEARRVQLEVLEQRQRTIKAEIRQRQQAAAAGAPPVRRGPIGRRAWTVDSPAESSSATGPLSSVTVELSLSKPLPLLGPPPSASSSLAEWAQGEDKQTEGAGGDVNGGGVRCSGTWSLQAPGEQAAAAEMRLKWTGLNTWQEQ